MILTTIVDEIQALMGRLPAKSGQLDPVYTILIKDCSSSFASLISQIVNLSIDQAYVPSGLKTAYILPFSKKPKLDSEMLNYYCLHYRFSHSNEFYVPSCSFKIIHFHHNQGIYQWQSYLRQPQVPVCADRLPPCWGPRPYPGPGPHCHPLPWPAGLGPLWHTSPWPSSLLECCR